MVSCKSVLPSLRSFVKVAVTSAGGLYGLSATITLRWSAGSPCLVQSRDAELRLEEGVDVHRIGRRNQDARALGDGLRGGCRQLPVLPGTREPPHVAHNTRHHESREQDRAQRAPPRVQIAQALRRQKRERGKHGNQLPHREEVIEDGVNGERSHERYGDEQRQQHLGRAGDPEGGQAGAGRAQ